MKKIFNKIMKFLLARPSIILTGYWPSQFNISVMQKYNEIQLSTEQLKVICATINRKAPCKLLVFGLGNDTRFWSIFNRRGVAMFLEDDKKWFQKTLKRTKGIKAFLIDYNSKRKDWKAFLEDTSLLNMTLPDEVEKEEWDVILVDAPAGYNDETPGRMRSIYLSSRLIKNSGEIFVHDCDREVEDIYCNKILKKENMKMEIKAPLGTLRHYHIPNRSS
jgi:glucuronoxylan 4-O-methyltransferase